MEEYNIEASGDWAGKRIDKVLSGYFSDYSRSFIKKLFDDGYIQVNGKASKPSYSVRTGDIFDIDSYLDKTKKYDCILLSNVMQYIDYFAPNKKEVYSFFREKFLEIEKHLNDEGILELCYLYSIFQNRKLVLDSSLPIYNLRKIYECLEDKSLYIEGIPSIHPNNEIMDAILTYKKR